MANPRRKQVVVLGLGTFGGALARQLACRHHQVTGIDLSESVVDQYDDLLFAAAVGDVTDVEVLKHLAVHEADVVYIALGDDPQKSTIAALRALELGALRVVVRGLDADHQTILEKVGVHQIVFPDAIVAESLAARLSEED